MGQIEWKINNDFKIADGQAKQDISEGKDYKCPVCSVTVSKHRDECHLCEYDPLGRNITTSSVSSRESERVRQSRKKSREDREYKQIYSAFFFFWFTFLAPIFYMISKWHENPTFSTSNTILMIASAIMIIAAILSIIGMIKDKRDAGCISLPIRIWVLIFSTLALIANIQIFT